MTYGRTLRKALEKFSIAPATWPQLAANRAAWRQTLQQGFAPKPFRCLPPKPLPPPLALTRPKRSITATGVADYTATNHFLLPLSSEPTGDTSPRHHCLVHLYSCAL